MTDGHSEYLTESAVNLLPTTVLVVDDDTHMLRATKTIMERENYIVLGASSGEDALAVLTEAPVDVVMSTFLRPSKKRKPQKF